MADPATRHDPTAGAAASRAERAAAAEAPRLGLDLGGVRVGVVVPAYRVAPHVADVIRGIPREIDTILVVDDRSPDETAEVVRELADPRVTLLSHDENRGVGGAMVTGFQEALRRKLDIVVKMDGDDQMDPRELPRLLQPLLDGRADLVKGNRYDSFAALRAMPIVRQLGNAGLTFLVKAASGYWNTFDPANGYVAVRCALLERIDLEHLPRRYFFESGFLIELGIQRAVVHDVPIAARYGSERSSLSIPRTLVGFPPKLLWGLVRRLFWRYFVHDFTAVSVFLLFGVPLLAYGLAYGVWYRLQDHPLGIVAPAGDVMAAALPIILGVQFLLQAVVLDVSLVPRTPISPPLPRRPPPGGAAG